MIRFIIDEEALMKAKHVKQEYKDNPELLIPKRSTSGSAGYDLIYPYEREVRLYPNETLLINSFVKVEMPKDIVCKMYIRSSVGIKKGIGLANGTGIIDSDFKESIKIPLINHLGSKINGYTFSHGEFYIEERSEPLSDTTGFETTEGIYMPNIYPGERVAQLVFEKYLTVDGDDTTTERTGGIGSTGTHE